MFNISRRFRSPKGFSLVEIMVGMVIGMLGIIVMMQVFALSEERKRTTTGSGDALNEGLMSMYALQRDIRVGGYGFSDPKLLNCNVLLRAGVTLNNLAPVTINHASIPAGDPNTDTLLVAYGNTNGSPQGDGISSQSATATYAVQTPTSFDPTVINGNVWVIASPPSRSSTATYSVACGLTLTLDRVVNVVGSNVNVTTGVAGMTNGTLFNLGQAPKILAYAIRGGALTMCDYTLNDCSAAGSTTNVSVWTPIASNIVSLRAQYGRDTSVPMDAIVDTFDQATPTTACGWSRTPAVRFALVARSAQYDKSGPTTAAPTWDGSAGAPIDLRVNATWPWHNYRYKVFETVVPIRNVVWMGAQTGC